MRTVCPCQLPNDQRGIAIYLGKLAMQARIRAKEIDLQYLNIEDGLELDDPSIVIEVFHREKDTFSEDGCGLPGNFVTSIGRSPVPINGEVYDENIPAFWELIRASYNVECISRDSKALHGIVFHKFNLTPKNEEEQ